MATAKEHAKVILSGIIPKRIDLLTQVRRELVPEHFASDPAYERMYQFLDRHAGITGGVMSQKALEDHLRNVEAGRRAKFVEIYAELAATDVDDADFAWSVHMIKELTAEQAMKTALTESMEIITKGLTNDKGELIKGQEAAREHALDSFADIDRSLAKQEAPQGNMREEADALLKDYEERKALRLSGELQGVNFGIAELDAKLGGLQRGELVLSAGYSSDGKTSLCVQLAWSAVVEQHKNVLFLTTETTNVTVRRKLIARHSKHPQFVEFGQPEGLNTRDLKAGTLTDLQEAFYQECIRNFTTTKAYGQLVIAQVPRGATLETVEAIMRDTQRQFDIDLVICDYLALLRATGNRNTDRESLSGVVKEAKQITTTFNKGRGVPFVSPWQVNRASREDAEKISMYTSKALAETAEATNSADVIVSILAPVDNTNRYAEIIGQILKARDGETANGLIMSVDYATSHFASREAFGSLATAGPALAGAPDLGGLDSLLD